MDALINLLMDDPFLLFTFGGGLIIVSFLLVVLVIHQRQKHINITDNQFEKNKTFANEKAKANSNTTQSGDAILGNWGLAKKNKDKLSTSINPNQSEQSNLAIKTLPTTTLPPNDESIKTDKQNSPFANLEGLNKKTDNQTLIDSTRLPLSGDMLLNIVREEPKATAPNQINDFFKKIRTSIMGKPQAHEDTDLTEQVKPPSVALTDNQSVMQKAEAAIEANHRSNKTNDSKLDESASAILLAMLKEQKESGELLTDLAPQSLESTPKIQDEIPEIKAQFMNHQFVQGNGEVELSQKGADLPLQTTTIQNKNSPSAKTTTYSQDVMKDFKKQLQGDIELSMPKFNPINTDNPQINHAISKEEQEHQLQITSMIQDSANIMKSVEAFPTTIESLSIIKDLPVNLESQHTNDVENTAIEAKTTLKKSSLAARTLAKIPFSGLFRKANTNSEKLANASDMANLQHKKTSIVSYQNENIKSSAPTGNKIEAKSLSIIKPISSESPGKDTQVLLTSHLVQSLEKETKKSLDRIAHKTGMVLPPLASGFIKPIQSMMSHEEAELLLSSLSNHAFEDSQRLLNDIVNKQTKLFMEWRRSFGKFSRLYSIINIDDDPIVAYKSMKKATELDSQEAWNWYAMGLLAFHLQKEDEYRTLMGNALSVAVSNDSTMSVKNALMREPKSEAKEVYVLVLLEMLSQQPSIEYAKTLLNTILKYFNNHEPTSVFLQEQRLKTALKMAELEQRQQQFKEAVVVLQEALAETYCEGASKFTILLSLIQLREHITLPPDKLHNWFNECIELSHSFLNQDSSGAQNHRTLGYYYLDENKFEQALPLFQSALILDQANEHEVDMVLDFHGLARSAKGINLIDDACSYWNKAQELLSTINLSVFDKSILADIYLSLGETLLESNKLDRAIATLEKGAKLIQEKEPSVKNANRLSYLGTQLFIRKQHSLALSFYAHAKNLLTKANAAQESREVCLSVAHCLFHLGEFAKSREELSVLTSILEVYPHPVFTSQTQALQALIFEAENKPHESIACANNALQELKPIITPKQSTDEAKALTPILKNIFSTIGRNYAKIGNNQAAKMFRSALYYCSPEDHDHLTFEKQLAHALFEQHEYAEGLEILESALKKADKNGNQSMQWEITVEIARGLIAINNNNQVEEMLTQVIEKTTFSGETIIQAKAVGVFADFNMAKNQIDDAISGYQESATLHHKKGQLLDEAIQKVKWAKALVIKNRLKEAETLLKEAGATLTNLSAERLSAEALISLAKVLLKQNRSEEAEVCYQKAAELYDKLELPEQVAEKYASLGILKMRRGKHSEAKQDWLKAKQTFERIGKKEGVLQVNNWLEMLGEVN